MRLNKLQQKLNININMSPIGKHNNKVKYYVALEIESTSWQTISVIGDQSNGAPFSVKIHKLQNHPINV